MEQPSADPAATIPVLRTKLRLVMKLLLRLTITSVPVQCASFTEQCLASPTGSPPRLQLLIQEKGRSLPLPQNVSGLMSLDYQPP